MFSSRMHVMSSLPSGQCSRDNLKLYHRHILIMQAHGRISRNNIRLHVRRVFFMNCHFSAVATIDLHAPLFSDRVGCFHGAS